jgi:peptide/nickel transport system substrate-binding protein
MNPDLSRKRQALGIGRGDGRRAAAGGAQRNYTGYCNPEVDALVERQSVESNQARRKQLVWEIERKMAEDDARPVLFYGRIGTCWHPQLKGLTVMVNSIYNMSRFEDIWLDK